MYFFQDSNGQQQGPVPASELPRYGVTPQTNVWKEGMANWQPAGSVAELAGIFASSPPIAPPPIVSPPPVASPQPPVAPLLPPVKKKRGVLLGIGGLIVLLVLICVGLYVFNDDFRQGFQKGTEKSGMSIGCKSKNPEDLARADETVFEQIFGDLNDDGQDDCVIITKQTKKEFASVENAFGEKVDRNRRGILIAFKDEKCYETVLAIPDCFSSENEDGGVYYAPEMSVEIEEGNLIIYYRHGRYGAWKYVFRYRNNNFELIGYEQSNNRGPITESLVNIDFLTKRKQTLTNTNPDADADEEVFEEVWQDIELTNGLVKLTDIKDFDEFYIDSHYISRGNIISTTTSSKTYTVRTAKTFFHVEPDASTVRKAFLVEGDKVDVEKTDRGFGYVSFTNTKGTVTKGWLKMDDLEK